MVVVMMLVMVPVLVVLVLVVLVLVLVRVGTVGLGPCAPTTVTPFLARAARWWSRETRSR